MIPYEMIMQNMLYYPELEYVYIAAPDTHPHNLKGHRILFPQIEIPIPFTPKPEKPINITTQHYLLENLCRIRDVMCSNFHIGEIFELLFKYVNKNLKNGSNTPRQQNILKMIDMFVKSMYVKHYMGDINALYADEIKGETADAKKFAISVKLFEFFRTINYYKKEYAKDYSVFIAEKPENMTEERYELVTQIYHISKFMKQYTAANNHEIQAVLQIEIMYVNPGQTHLHYVNWIYSQSPDKPTDTILRQLFEDLQKIIKFVPLNKKIKPKYQLFKGVSKGRPYRPEISRTKLEYSSIMNSNVTPLVHVECVY
jgi:hypothetical protein